jgi:heme/copper-type cytochrome/quinol oxidase subunit 2
LSGWCAGKAGVSTFVRFSDDRWLLFFIIVTLFVVFVFVIVPVRVFGWEADESDKARTD